MNSFFRNPIFVILVLLIFSLSIIFFFSDVLTPYVFSIILGYLLAPLVDRLENLGLPRPISGLAILIFAVSIIIGVILLVGPVFIKQVQALIFAFPDIYNQCLITLKELLPNVIGKNLSLENGFLDITEILKARGLNIASEIASYASTMFDLILLVLLVPVITFYILIDWKKIVLSCERFLPRNSSTEIYEIFLKIDNMLSGFVRGQLIICVALGVLYSITLSMLGLQYGLLIGVFSGLVSFIPFLGALLGGFVATSVAIYQFWVVPSVIVAVVAIFVIGQLFESNYLTPKLIGKAVSLHPILIMLSVSIGGAFAGLTGVLLAVPLAGILAILVRHMVSTYLTGDLFEGTE